MIFLSIVKYGYILYNTKQYFIAAYTKSITSRFILGETESFANGKSYSIAAEVALMTRTIRITTEPDTEYGVGAKFIVGIHTRYDSVTEDFISTRGKLKYCDGICGNLSWRDFFKIGSKF